MSVYACRLVYMISDLKLTFNEKKTTENAKKKAEKQREIGGNDSNLDG